MSTSLPLRMLLRTLRSTWLSLPDSMSRAICRSQSSQLRSSIQRTSLRRSPAGSFSMAALISRVVLIERKFYQVNPTRHPESQPVRESSPRLQTACVRSRELYRQAVEQRSNLCNESVPQFWPDRIRRLRTALVTVLVIALDGACIAWRQANADELTVSRLTVVDEKGTSRIVIGGDRPGLGRISPSVGITIHHETGRWRD